MHPVRGGFLRCAMCHVVVPMLTTLENASTSLKVSNHVHLLGNAPTLPARARYTHTYVLNVRNPPKVPPTSSQVSARWQRDETTPPSTMSRQRGNSSYHTSVQRSVIYAWLSSCRSLNGVHDQPANNRLRLRAHCRNNNRCE